MRDRALRFCARMAIEKSVAVVVIAVLLAAGSAYYAATSLKLNANTDDLISPDRPYMKTYLEFIEDWGDLEAIWVVIDTSRDPALAAQAKKACDRLGEKIAALDEIPGVYWKIGVDEQLRIATRAKDMSDEDLRGLSEASGALPLLMSEGGAGAMLVDARQSMNRLITLGGFLGDEKQRRLGAQIFLQTDLLLKGLDSGAEIELRDEYIRSGSGRFFFVRVEPKKDYGTMAVINEPLRKIREIISEVETEFPKLSFGLTGKPVLQADEMATSDRDMTRATIVAIVLVALLFMIIVGGLIRPALAVGTLLLALAWTFGLTTLVVGQLNLLSVVFALVLVGIGIDFGVHIVTRYYEERARHALPEAVRRSVMAVGRGNLTGAATSSLAFFMAMFTGFQGLVELGFIAGSGLLLCVTAMTLVLPAAIVMTRRRGDDRESRPVSSAAPKSAGDRKASGPPKIRLLCAAAVSLAALWFAPRVVFDDDILELQAQDLDSVVWERKILEDDAAESWFGGIVVGSLANLRHLQSVAEMQPSIGETHSVLDIIQEESPERESWRKKIAEASEFVLSIEPDRSDNWPVEQVTLLRKGFERLESLARRRGKKEDLKEIEERRVGLAALENALLDPKTGSEVRSRVNAVREESRARFRTIVEGAALPLYEAIPELPRRMFCSKNGRYLLMMHPAKNVWDLEYMRDYVLAMRQVHPDVTGAPVSHLESIHDMRSGFIRAALLAFIAVFAVVLFDFRRLGLTFLAILPLAVSGLWLLGAMGALGLSFNLANFFSVPILIGIGVDNGVHLVHRWREGAGNRHFDLGSTRRAVLMTSLTTAIGFGCLSSASHLGLRSLGYIMALGSLAILLSSLLVLPALLQLLPQGRAGRRRAE